MRPIFLICVLAYYVEWHLRRAWRPFLFEDEELDRDREERDPVAPRGRRPRRGGRRRRIRPPGTCRCIASGPCWRTWGPSRETYQVVSGPSGTTFQQLTELDPVQGETLRLLET